MGKKNVGGKNVGKKNVGGKDVGGKNVGKKNVEGKDVGKKKNVGGKDVGGKDVGRTWKRGPWEGEAWEGRKGIKERLRDNVIITTTAFLYCKRQKAGRGMGMRLNHTFMWTMSHLLLEPLLVSPVHPKLHLQIKKYTKSTFVGTYYRLL